MVMDNPFCNACDPERYMVNGNCTRSKAKDGYVAKCGQPWADEKLRILRLYNRLFTVGMKNKWELNYIDLFAGPGIYFDRRSGLEKPGSPMIPDNSCYKTMIFNDIIYENYEALNHRIKNAKGNIVIKNQNANKIANDINSMLSLNSLSFCFLDPSNMGELKFNTIEKLTLDKRIDLLINFPYVDYRRSFRYSLDKKIEKERIDDFFGTDAWRDIEEKLARKEARYRADALLDIYINQLEKIGYSKINYNKRHLYIFPIHNTRKGLLYYLIFVSKHNRGYDFCEKMRPYAIGQQEFKYD
jgi:three-Cys-motif partner protein